MLICNAELTRLSFEGRALAEPGNRWGFSKVTIGICFNRIPELSIQINNAYHMDKKGKIGV